MAYRRTMPTLDRPGPGPAWYRALGSTQSQPPGARVRRLPKMSLGSLGDDAPGPTTLSTPTIADPTAQWQADVLGQLRAGVATMQKAELQKWLQIAATVSIPLFAAVWKLIFKNGRGISETGV